MRPAYAGRSTNFIPDDDPTHVAFVDKGLDLIHQIPSEHLHFLDKVLKCHVPPL
jgi:hypothetical protein